MEPSLRVRALTVFVGLDHDASVWPDSVSAAATFLRSASAALTAAGLEVQTTRIATNPFPEYARNGHEFEDIQQLEALCLSEGIQFLAVSGSGDVAHLSTAVAVATRCSHTCIAFQLPQLVSRAGSVGAADVGSHADARKIYEACARAVLDIADLTDGEGNFRFCAAANVEPGGPFFPAASGFSLGPHVTAPNGDVADTTPPHDASTTLQSMTSNAPCRAKGLQGFGIGTENDALLSAACCGNSDWDVSQRVYDALLQPMTKISEVCQRLESSEGIPFVGIDTSVNPGLDTPSLTESFKSLSGADFGCPGTLAACASVTQALKALPVRKTGYCGLMLPVCEDVGLAAAAAKGALDVQLLLACSSVCGVGLDTVPVPGRSGDPVADEELLRLMAFLMMDLSCMAFRLNKPLSCRLLPQPGKRPGDATTFTSPFLINSCVMPLAQARL